MNEPKYKIGDRFTVMQHVEIEIIRPIDAPEPAYIFKLVKSPRLQSVVTQTELDIVTTSFKANG